MVKWGIENTVMHTKVRLELVFKYINVIFKILVVKLKWSKTIREITVSRMLVTWVLIWCLWRFVLSEDSFAFSTGIHWGTIGIWNLHRMNNMYVYKPNPMYILTLTDE